MLGPMLKHIEKVQRPYKRMVDTLFPPRCVRCSQMVAESGGGLCALCFDHVHFSHPPHCKRCSAPFEYDNAAETLLCPVCIATPPLYERALYVFRYDEGSRTIIRRFKYEDATYSVPILAAWLTRAGAPLWPDAELLIPVPLHPWRLWQRRYNQAALLALAVGKLANIPVMVDTLARTKYTTAQAKLGFLSRWRNLASGQIIATLPHRVAGKHVVIIDDVMTTGATIDACCRALHRAKVGRISVLTLARTLRTGT
jgi:ComF family protein